MVGGIRQSFQILIASRDIARNSGIEISIGGGVNYINRIARQTCIYLIPAFAIVREEETPA